MSNSTASDAVFSGCPASISAPSVLPVFIQDDRLQEAPTVASLVHWLDPFSTEAPCESLIKRFLADPGIYALPVVNHEDQPLALVDRKRFVEFFAKPYSKELFGRQSILGFLGSSFFQGIAPLVLEESSSIEDAARIIIASGMEHMVTGFIVTCDGRYRGIANGHDLLNLITQRKQAELYYLAHYDHLTGVPNRVLLADRIAQACREAERKGSLVALLFIDVDRFKQVNDSLGHRVGDAVLRALVNRLKGAARKVDTVARIGGDEFMLLMEDLSSAQAADLVASRIVESMQQPMEIHGHSLIVTVSIGIALFPRDDADVSRLMAKADAAMYEAKSKGRNGFRIFDDGSASFNPERLSLENDLRLALERNELRLVFQPQVEISSQKVRGAEALLRWHHPVRGNISPLEFIPIAEETGLIVPLGRWVIRSAFAQMARWKSMSLPPIRMAINISAVQFHQDDFADELEMAIHEYQIDPSLVELELTESVLMHNVEDVLANLNRIKRLGIMLAIDDFGTGFSSLNYLRRFPIDRLKIDQSFVRGIAETPANASITKAIIALADSLSLDVVAEGIENASENEFLSGIGCGEGQGYFFARPLSPEQLEACLLPVGTES